jgi:hypothetical protein
VIDEPFGWNMERRGQGTDVLGVRGPGALFEPRNIVMGHTATVGEALLTHPGGFTDRAQPRPGMPRVRAPSRQHATQMRMLLRREQVVESHPSLPGNQG